jgi:voltage-dependent potassium channel beta subunit
MEYRKLGNTGLRVSEVSLGSWLTMGNAVEDETSRDLVDFAFDHGINFFDTADVYARGEGELAMAKALEGIPRKDYVLATKCFFPMSEGPNDRGLSRKHIHESLHASLKRLRSDYVDLLQCHRYDDDTPLEETCRAMSDLVSQGKILYWGVSMWTAEQIREACRICDEGGYYAPVSNQPLYNAIERELETDVMPTCAELGLGLVVFSPLAQGVLTGKYARDAWKEGSTLPETTRAGDERVNAFIRRYLTDERLGQVEQFELLAKELDTSPAALSLAWCLRRPELSSVIVGATRTEQLEQNVAATKLELGEEVWNKIDAIFSSES